VRRRALLRRGATQLLHQSQFISRSKIVPGALTDNDPVAFRQTLFRIAVSDVRGREAKMKPLERNDRNEEKP
jgi:hypothetical protein